MVDSEKQYRASGADDKQIIALQSQELASLKSFKEKNELEFSRYKQDCRKRALDLAAGQLQTPVFQKWIDENKLVETGNNSLQDKSPIMADELLMGLADKYYNWLISIPEK